MPNIIKNQPLRNSFQNKANPRDQQTALNPIYPSFTDANLTDDSQGSIPQTVQTIDHDLWNMISIKDEFIQTLTFQLNIMRNELSAKTFQAQSVKTQTQKVAQILRSNSSLKSQNNLLKQKLALYQQVNSRQYQEIMNLEKEKSLLNVKVKELEGKVKAEVTSHQMKLSQMRIELASEKKKIIQFQKQVKILKAIIKELQENQSDSQSDDQKQNRQFGQKKRNFGSYSQGNQGKTTSMSPNCEQTCEASKKSQKNAHPCSNSQSCYWISKQNCSNHYPNSCVSSAHRVEAELEEQIIFM